MVTGEAGRGRPGLRLRDAARPGSGINGRWPRLTAAVLTPRSLLPVCTRRREREGPAELTELRAEKRGSQLPATRTEPRN